MLLTKAIGALPQTHPLSILAPRCDELPGGKAGESNGGGLSVNGAAAR